MLRNSLLSLAKIVHVYRRSKIIMDFITTSDGLCWYEDIEDYMKLHHSEAMTGILLVFHLTGKNSNSYADFILSV